MVRVGRKVGVIKVIGCPCTAICISPFFTAFENHIHIMEVTLGSDKGSDFITNFAFVPPSPRLEPVFDYPAFDSAAPITSPPLPHTSSYNGSYYSPYSQHSELSFSGDDIQLQDFPNPMNEYEPLDYDPPTDQPTSLLMFTNNSDYMSPHFSPNNRSTPFDHSSPSSNASGADENNITHLDDLRRSRPSSVASNYPSPALPSSPQPTFNPSPRLSANFEIGRAHV